jgi:hypothetical protein
MFALLIFHPLLRQIYNNVYPVSHESSRSQLGGADNGSSSSSMFKSAAAADERLEQRVGFDLRFGLFFIVALHGFSVFKILLILYANYSIATRLPKSQVPIATWLFNIGILFANELYDGYRYASLARIVTPWLADSKDNWGAWMDSYGGLISRWHILFNIAVLRLISYNMDYLWSLESKGESLIEVSVMRALPYLPPY